MGPQPDFFQAALHQDPGAFCRNRNHLYDSEGFTVSVNPLFSGSLPVRCLTQPCPNWPPVQPPAHTRSPTPPDLFEQPVSKEDNEEEETDDEEDDSEDDSENDSEDNTDDKGKQPLRSVPTTAQVSGPNEPNQEPESEDRPSASQGPAEGRTDQLSHPKEEQQPKDAKDALGSPIQVDKQLEPENQKPKSFEGIFDRGKEAINNIFRQAFQPNQPTSPEQPKQPQAPVTSTTSQAAKMTDTKELRIAIPQPYKGERTKLNAFKRAVELYLEINKAVYAQDPQKIGFLLSLLQEGDVANWKEQWLDANLANLSTIKWSDFLTDFTNAFKETDSAGNALWRIKHLKQGNRTAEDHVNEFKILVSAAGLDTTQNKDIAVRDYFADTLNRPLLKRILEDPKTPTDIAGWYEMAIKYDNQYRRNRDIFGRDTARVRNKPAPRRTWNWNTSSARDPNAMDIDALTIEEREDLLRKGACFFCRTPGHIANHCPKKRNQSNQPRTAGSTSTNWRTKSPKEIATHIRALLDEAGEDVESEVRRIASEEGF